ncbi:MAG: Uncharacterised protein [Prochlorococcus marinus str. MIT 9215]|nr:MAG: Uncharacterised protein [Prochlorococcus marinus str. MIT 9215]
MAQKLVPKGVTHWGTAHGKTGVAAVGLIDRIDSQHADAVDAKRVEGGSRSDHGVGFR